MVTENNFLIDEIKRAINELDFFRTFRLLCSYLGAEQMMIVDLNDWPQQELINIPLGVLNNSEDTSFNLEMIFVDPESTMFSSLRSSIVAELWNADETEISTAFLKNKGSRTAFTFPMHMPNGRHYGILGIIEKDVSYGFNLAQASYISSIFFDRYYDRILLDALLPVISPRERNVINWSAEGKTVTEIAVILGLSEDTVTSYTAKLQNKLGASNRTQMVANSIRIGLI